MGPTPLSPPTASTPPSAEEHIAAALESGRIDLATSLVYRVYAAFGSTSLPEEFRSPVIDLHSATYVFTDIAADDSVLSPEQIAAIAPYMARPNDPASVFSQAQPVAAVGGIFTGLVTWVNAPAAGGKARVWLAAGDGADARLATFVAAVDLVWPKVFGLVPEPLPDAPNLPLPVINPDSAIDLYFIDAGTVDQRVYNCRFNPDAEGCDRVGDQGGFTQVAKPVSAGHKSSAYSVIDSAVKGAVMTSHIAHELTHTSQFQYDFDESPWLLDSTATWAAYRVLQKLGTAPTPAYEYLPKLFATLDRPITRDTKGEEWNRYAAWLYVQSLSIRHGEGVAKTVFEKMAADGEQGSGAVEAAYPFDQNFASFAVGNWNEGSADQYLRKDPSFPRDAPKHRPVVDLDEVMADGDVRPLDFETGPLSADYASLAFRDGIQVVSIENSLTGPSGPSVWLIELIAGQWKKPYQLTEERKLYCRNRAGEELEKLVIVVANPDLEKPVSRDQLPTVRARSGACEGGGTITISHDKSGTYTSARNNPVEVNLHHEARISFDLVVDAFDSQVYTATQSTITWSYSLTATETGDDCTILERAEGAGSVTGEGGPSLTYGMKSDGTLFGITFEDDAYTLGVLPPTLEMEDGDPRSHYRIWSDLCGFMSLSGWFPYYVLGFASGTIPADRGALDGSVQRTIPPLLGLDNLPTTETITWSVDL